MTDFGADDSFGKGAKKVKEHYGIEVPISGVRTVTQAHSEAMLREEPQSELGKQRRKISDRRNGREHDPDRQHRKQ